MWYGWMGNKLYFNMVLIDQKYTNLLKSYEALYILTIYSFFYHEAEPSYKKNGQ